MPELVLSFQEPASLPGEGGFFMGLLLIVSLLEALS
jgi:hypothetical protein